MEDAGRTPSWDGLARTFCASASNNVRQPPYSADYMQGTRLSFKTKEDAIHFAEKQGMSLELLRFSYLAHLFTI